MNFWLNLKKKVAVLFERDSSRIRLIAWRDRVTKVLLFLDNHFIKISLAVFLSLILFGTLYFFSWRAPKPFPEQALITIARGESLTQIANSFGQEKIVRSGFWLKTFIFILGGQKKVIAGDYYFPSAVNIFKVAKMIHNGEFGLIAKKITIPEGTTSVEMAKILEKELPTFNAKNFTDEVSNNNYEGYLFPDTYFLMPNTKASDIILMMRENFARQIKPYDEDILKFEKPLNEIIIMASIIEEEANSSIADKRIIAGILWKRLKKNMPLQVDSPFQYYNGKNSYTLTKDDLAENHPYNTYLNKGLPPTAISNPGIDSIRAAITPTPTDYLYFLSDKKGNMYYAKTFAEHKINKELYLN